MPGGHRSDRLSPSMTVVCFFSAFARCSGQRSSEAASLGPSAAAAAEMWVICKKKTVRAQTCLPLCNVSLWSVFCNGGAQTLFFFRRRLVFSQAQFNCTSNWCAYILFWISYTVGKKRVTSNPLAHRSTTFYRRLCCDGLFRVSVCSSQKGSCIFITKNKCLMILREIIVLVSENLANLVSVEMKLCLFYSTWFEQ